MDRAWSCAPGGTWSPDGAYLLYVAWTYPTATSEQTLVVAVPTDHDAPAVLLADMDGIAPATSSTCGSRFRYGDAAHRSD